MTVKDIYTYIDSIAPFSSAEGWDNVGLLIGNSDTEVTTAVIALDCTLSALNAAKANGAQLIITHHPVVFDPLKNLCADSLAYKLAEAGISVISAHTNLDIAERGVNRRLCDVLELNAKPENTESALMIGEYAKEYGTENFIAFIKEKLNCPVVRACVCGNTVKKVAVCCGSGGDLLAIAKNAGADTFVTGDVKHNVFVEAKHMGINLIDAGHFHTEDIIIDSLCESLTAEFSTVRFIQNHSEPFSVF